MYGLVYFCCQILPSRLVGSVRWSRFAATHATQYCASYPSTPNEYGYCLVVRLVRLPLPSCFVHKLNPMEPVRCITCNAMLRFKQYDAIKSESCAKTALDAMAIRRFCCRRMYLTHPEDLECYIRSFPLRDRTTEDYDMKFESTLARRVSTD